MTGRRAPRVPLCPWGRCPPLCPTGDASLGKAWSQPQLREALAHFPGEWKRAWNASQADVKAFPDAHTCNLPGSQGRCQDTACGWGLAQLKSGQNWLVQEGLDPSPWILFPVWCPEFDTGLCTLLPAFPPLVFLGEATRMRGASEMEVSRPNLGPGIQQALNMCYSLSPSTGMCALPGMGWISFQAPDLASEPCVAMSW